MPGISLGPKEGPEGTWDICVSPLLYRAVASKHFVLLCDESANEQASKEMHWQQKIRPLGYQTPAWLIRHGRTRLAKGQSPVCRKGHLDLITQTKWCTRSHEVWSHIDLGDCLTLPLTSCFFGKITQPMPEHNIGKLHFLFCHSFQNEPEFLILLKIL